jgi:MFS family permease
MISARGWQVFAVGLGTAVVPLDTAVNIGFPAITRAFGLAIGDIQWVVIAYVLTYASLMLAVGRIGDILGHAAIFASASPGAPSPTCSAPWRRAFRCCWPAACCRGSAPRWCWAAARR